MSRTRSGPLVDLLDMAAANGVIASTTIGESGLSGSVSSTDRLPPQPPIYLDYNATSPMAPRVITAMMPFFARLYGNASSSHAYGVEARTALDEARGRVATLLNGSADEIVFTSGGSEANNLAIKGVAMRFPPGETHVITSVIDHPSVIKTCYYLAQRHGVSVTLIPVDEFGMVDPETVARAVTEKTRLISIMLANNEVGTIQPIAEVAVAARKVSPTVLVHADAAQAAGKIKIDVGVLGVDMLTIAAHKFCGPKGVGALYVRDGVELDALIQGAGHEQGLRSGTENIPGVVGLGLAAQLAFETQPEETYRLRGLRDLLQDELMSSYQGAVVNGHPEQRLPNTLNISFPGLIGNDILAEADGVAASTGAACHSGSVEPSTVLLSMGLSVEVALGALRLSLGRYTTDQQITTAVEELRRAVHKLAVSDRGSSKMRLPRARRRVAKAGKVSAPR